MNRIKWLGLIYLIAGGLLLILNQLLLGAIILALGLFIILGPTGIWDSIIAIFLLLVLILISPLIVNAILQGSSMADYPSAITAIATTVSIFLYYYIFIRQDQINRAQFIPQAVIRTPKQKANKLFHEAVIYNFGKVPITHMDVYIRYVGEIKGPKKLDKNFIESIFLPVRKFVFGIGTMTSSRAVSVISGSIKTSTDKVIIPGEELPFSVQDIISRYKINIKRDKLYLLPVFLRLFYDKFDYTTKDYDIYYIETSNEDGSYASNTFIHEEWVDEIKINRIFP